MKRLFTKEDIQTADMYMKRCSPPSAIRQMQIKTMMRCHYTPMRTAKIIKIMTRPNTREDSENPDHIHCLENNTAFLTKLTVQLTQRTTRGKTVFKKHRTAQSQKGIREHKEKAI